MRGNCASADCLTKRPCFADDRGMKQPLLKRGGLRAISYLRRLTSAERNAAADAHLGQTLCFVAGAVNAGGFLAVGQYTSHMSGIASAVADSFALGNFVLALLGAGSLLSFMAGAACSAILINWGRRHDTRNQFTFPLLLEAVFLLCFGLFASNLPEEGFYEEPRAHHTRHRVSGKAKYRRSGTRKLRE